MREPERDEETAPVDARQYTDDGPFYVGDRKLFFVGEIHGHLFFYKKGSHNVLGFQQKIRKLL